MQVVVVHNKKAGDDPHDRRRLLELIRARGHDLSCYSRDDPAWSEVLEHPRAGIDLVVAAGGDGTFESVARVMAGSKIPLTILPFGTANNVLTAFGLANAPIEALVDGWSEPIVHPLDIGVARGPWGTMRFVESVGVGLLADGMHAIDTGNESQVNTIEDPETRLTLAIGILSRMLGAIEARPFHLSVDGRPLPGRYLLVEAFNLGLAGPNLRLAPDADPTDGMFDVVLVHEHLRRDLISRLPLYRLDPRSAPALPVWKARHVTLARGSYIVHVDDKVCGLDCGDKEASDIELTVEPGAIRFLMPHLPSHGH